MGTVILAGMLFIPFMFFEVMLNIIAFLGVKGFCKIFQKDDNTSFSSFLKGLRKLVIFRVSMFPIIALFLDIINFIVSKNKTIYNDFLSEVSYFYVNVGIVFWSALLLIAILVSTCVLIRYYFGEPNIRYKPRLIFIVMLISSSIIGLIFSFQGILMYWAT